MRKVLFVTTISGFLPQFEKNDVKLLGEMGCQVHYASNFRNPVYAFDEKELKSQGIFLHHIDIAKIIEIRRKSGYDKRYRKLGHHRQRNALKTLRCLW